MSAPLNIIPLAENFRGARAPCAPVVPPPMHYTIIIHVYRLFLRVCLVVFPCSRLSLFLAGSKLCAGSVLANLMVNILVLDVVPLGQGRELTVCTHIILPC